MALGDQSANRAAGAHASEALASHAMFVSVGIGRWSPKA
jgi:hypothetical protein